MAKPKLTPSRLLTAEEAGVILDVHRSTVLRMARAGELEPALRGPGRTGVYLFDARVVESAARTRTASGSTGE